MTQKRAEPPHGTAGGYQNHGCRCPACREAHRIAMHQYRVRIGVTQ